MHLVFRTIHNQILWDEKFEVESLEAFVEKRNKRVIESGSKRATFYVSSPRQVTETEWDGKIKGTYNLCDPNSCRLI